MFCSIPSLKFLSLICLISLIYCEDIALDGDYLSEKSMREMKHKNMKDQIVVVQMDLFINNKNRGLIPVELDTTNHVLHFNIDHFVKVVSENMTDYGLDLFTRFIESNPSMFVDETLVDKDMFFNLRFSKIDQTVHLEILPTLIRMRIEDFDSSRNADNRNEENIIEGSDFSGYINGLMGYRYNRSFVVNDTSDFFDNAGNGDMFVHLDCVANYKDFILNGFVYFLNNNYQNSINRGNILLTKDLLSHKMTMSLGDLSILGTSFQNSIPILGCSINKSDRIFIDNAIGPVSRREIFLNLPSKVEVYLNGVLLKVLELDAGPHSLQNFPLIDGLNHVSLKIYSPLGGESTIDLDYFYNSRILPTDTFEYYAVVGFPTYQRESISKMISTDSGFHYYSLNPVFSSFVNYGISSQSSCQGYLQLDQSSRFFGGNYTWSDNRLHSVLEAGGSHSRDNGFDIAARMVVGSSLFSKLPFNWRISFDYTGPKFFYLGDKCVDNPDRSWSTTFGLNFPLTQSTNVGLINEYINNRISSNRYVAQVNLYQYLSSFLSLKGYVSYKKSLSSSEDPVWDAAFNISMNPTIKNTRVRTTYNSKQQTIQFDTSYILNLPFKEYLDCNVGYSGISGEQMLTGGFNYDTNYGRIGLNSYLAQTDNASAISSVSVTNFNMGSALAFAGDTFAISRPLLDSFVIVAPNKHLSGNMVIIDPNSDGDGIARAYYRWPTVVPMDAYSKRSLLFSTYGDSPAGQGFEGNSFTAYSKRKSGGVIKIGTEPKYIVEAIVKDQKSNLITDIGGLIISEKGEQQGFFVDSYGRIQIPNISLGKYTVILAGKTYCSQSIEITTEDKDNVFVDLGDLFFEFSKEQKNRSERLRSILNK